MTQKSIDTCKDNLITSSLTTSSKTFSPLTIYFKMTLRWNVWVLTPIIIILLICIKTANQHNYPTPFWRPSSNSSPVSTASANNAVKELTFITLSFGSKGAWRDSLVTHNCLMLNKENHKNHNTISTGSPSFRTRFIIYTDNLTQPYCSICECKQFQPANCSCPPNGKLCETRRQCEKLFFTTSMIATYDSFVFLDHDLIILKDTFAAHLARRALDFDFLASRTHFKRDRYFGNAQNYYQVFNSGLFFIRRLPYLEVDEPKWLMYNETSADANTDQVYLSRWVLNRYKKWDELSFKWHCRDLKDQNIPFEHCYTLHDSGNPELVLNEHNFSLLQIL